MKGRIWTKICVRCGEPIQPSQGFSKCTTKHSTVNYEHCATGDCTATGAKMELSDRCIIRLTGLAAKAKKNTWDGDS